MLPAFGNPHELSDIEEIQDEVGGTQSSISFQTFDVKYEGKVYSLPQELVHEVDVGPNGEFSTRVYEIVPDAMP